MARAPWRPCVGWALMPGLQEQCAIDGGLCSLSGGGAAALGPNESSIGAQTDVLQAQRALCSSRYIPGKSATHKQSTLHARLNTADLLSNLSYQPWKEKKIH